MFWDGIECVGRDEIVDLFQLLFAKLQFCPIRYARNAPDDRPGECETSWCDRKKALAEHVFISGKEQQIVLRDGTENDKIPIKKM